MVMITPSKKLTNTMSQIFFDFVIQLPTLFPIGVIAVSAPSVKKAMPIISIAAPVRNDTSMLFGIGETVKHHDYKGYRKHGCEGFPEFILQQIMVVQTESSFRLKHCNRGAGPVWLWHMASARGLAA